MIDPTALPRLGPTTGRRGRRVRSISIDSSGIRSRPLTFSSSSTCSVSSRSMAGSWLSPPPPESLIRTVGSGCRTRMPDAERAACPSATTRRVRSTAASSASSRRPPGGLGKSARCTESGASWSTPATRFSQIASATCGTNGASRRVKVASTSYSVADAAALSVSSSPFQNRRRLRRTYQFDRSSTKASMARVARCASQPFRAAPTSAVTASRRDRIHRSSRLRSELAPAVSAGSQPSSRAYATKKA